MRWVRWFVLLIPMAFLFHYFETSFYTYGATFAFGGTFIYIILAGFLSTRSSLAPIFLLCTIATLGSVWLGTMFITPPNDSWFNPFGMNGVVILTGGIILIGILIVRFFSRVFLLKEEKPEISHGK